MKLIAVASVLPGASFTSDAVRIDSHARSGASTSTALTRTKITLSGAVSAAVPGWKKRHPARAVEEVRAEVESEPIGRAAGRVRRARRTRSG